MNSQGVLQRTDPLSLRERARVRVNTLATRPPQHLPNRLQLSQDIIVSEPQHLVSLGLKPLRPSCIIFLLIPVMPSVDFDDETVLHGTQSPRCTCRPGIVCETWSSSSDDRGVSTRGVVQHPWIAFSTALLWKFLSSLLPSHGWQLYLFTLTPTLSLRERGSGG